jgi:cysteine-rich repeat protein
MYKTITLLFLIIGTIATIISTIKQIDEKKDKIINVKIIKDDNKSSTIDFMINKSKEACENTHSQNIYVDNKYIDKFMFNSFWSNKEQVISKNNTKVSLWSSDNDLIAFCNKAKDWFRPSFFSPGNNTKVIAIGANCRFNKPKKQKQNELQIVYQIGYYDIIKDTGKLLNNYNLEYYETLKDMKNENKKSKYYMNIGFSNLQFADKVCYNIKLTYCGDGVTQKEHNEQCDDGNNNSDDGCNSTCNEEY